jgi:hypothetical protein
MKKMTVKQFAKELVTDLWAYDFSGQPMAEIRDVSSFQVSQDNPTESSQRGFLTLADIACTHIRCQTTKRDGSKKNEGKGELVRRYCSMKGEGCTGRKMSYECGHQKCMAKAKRSNNRHSDTTGVFICENVACMKKHWDEILVEAS